MDVLRSWCWERKRQGVSKSSKSGVGEERGKQERKEESSRGRKQMINYLLFKLAFLSDM